MSEYRTGSHTKTRLTLHQHQAGEKLQLDFAGKRLDLTDTSTGEQTKY